MLQEKGISIYREVVYFWTEILLNIPQSRNTDDDLIMIYIITIYKIQK